MAWEKTRLPPTPIQPRACTRQKANSQAAIKQNSECCRVVIEPSTTVITTGRKHKHSTSCPIFPMTGQHSNCNNLLEIDDLLHASSGCLP